MIDLELLHDCYVTTSSKIVLLVVDGLGGLPHPDTGRSELETANLPNLDAMARESACGMTTPVLPGVAPGSGPGHLALFGYDPLKYIIGRGALEALGIDAELRPGDVAARGNFCTVDGDGNLVDRRAGRIPTEFSAPLCERLDTIELPGVQLDVFPVQDYRFVLRLRGEGLSESISETDPQISGVPALPVSRWTTRQRRLPTLSTSLYPRRPTSWQKKKEAIWCFCAVGPSCLPCLPWATCTG